MPEIYRPRWTYESTSHEGENEFNASLYETEAYRERTQGIGKGVRADREATARAKAVELALKYADERPDTLSLGTVFTYADEIAAYILNGKNGTQS